MMKIIAKEKGKPIIFSLDGLENAKKKKKSDCGLIFKSSIA